MFNAFFVCRFDTDERPRGCQGSELEDHDCENEQLPADPELLKGPAVPAGSLQSSGVWWHSSENAQRAAGVIMSLSQWLLNGLGILKG